MNLLVSAPDLLSSLFMSLQVFIKREGDKMSLIVDGISTQSKRIPGGDKSHLTGPLYVGGVPPSLTVKHPDYTLTSTAHKKLIVFHYITSLVHV